MTQELFSKLRFSYIEQVTKERFLRAITSETPLFVEPHENARMEAQLLEEKATLKAQKDEVAKMVAELEIRGKELAAREEPHPFIQNMPLTIFRLRENSASKVNSS
jgi:hypothetical protein